MGIRAGDCGISIQFCQADGQPDGPPVHGRYIKLSGKPRQDVIKAGPPETPDEKQFEGSEDWLTLIIVADTEEKLNAIAKHHGPVSPPHTSHSSRRVCIETHIKRARRTYGDRITIASGPIVSLNPRNLRIDAVHVKALPAGAELRKMKKCPFKEEFVGGAIALNQIVQSMAADEPGKRK